MTREKREEFREQYGYTYRCRGCGQWSDTPNCGCMPDEDGTAAEQEAK